MSRVCASSLVLPAAARTPPLLAPAMVPTQAGARREPIAAHELSTHRPRPALRCAHLIAKAPVVCRCSAGRGAARRSLLDDRLAGAPEDLGFLSDAAVKALLLGIADHSPYLWRLIRADPARLAPSPRDARRKRSLDALPRDRSRRLVTPAARRPR